MPGSPTTPGWAGTRDDAPVHVAFRASDHVCTRDFLAFAAQWLAYALPYRRFADTLANANARLGADADRYSFTVVDFHLLLFAGFDRRTIRTRLPGPFHRLRRAKRGTRPVAARAISAPPQPTFLAPSARKRPKMLWGERRGNGTIVAVSKPTGVPHATGQ